ncbi:MAG TPA: hypothetical protein VKF36_04360 [Syntrophorhabdales bacterium]|nr:hypothetical protein [Syntrophorhabdales bacterium]
MKKLFVYIAMMLLFSAGAVFAGEGDSYGTQPYRPESGSDPQAQGAKPDSGSQKSCDPTSGECRPEKAEEAGSSYRQEEPNNGVKSRWQLDIGGSVKMDVERRQ